MLMPALTAAREEGLRVKCASNLRTHTQRIRLAPRGDLFDLSSTFPINQYGTRTRIMIRGEGWRYDTVPAVRILERFIDEYPD